MKWTKDEKERFWAKVRILGINDCWIWIGATDSSGYGSFKAGGKTIGTHRFSYLDCFGSIPLNLCVLHTCDEPGCVNPKHLWLGTQKDNMRDAMNKGRIKLPFTQGEDNSQSKLQDEDIRMVRNLFDLGMRQCDISKFMGVGNGCVNKIVHRKAWAHVE